MNARSAGEPKKPKMGRPPKRASERRSVQLTVRCTEAEAARIRQRSRAAGIEVAEYLRLCALGKLYDPE